MWRAFRLKWCGLSLSLSLSLSLGLGLVLCAPVLHAERAIHMYKQPDGSRLYTDQKRRKSGYTYLGEYGRRTYRVSCAGYQTALMQARVQRYQPWVERFAAEYQVDPRLIAAVMRVESCLDRHAVSRAGARGLMQLMPATAHELGVHDVFDPAENIRGGTAYLSYLLKRFDQREELALAAYNAGPGAVERYGGVPPYKETEAYIKRVAKHYRQAGGSL